MEKKFGDRLLEIRNARGLTQDRFSELLGMPKRTYQDLEYNKGAPSLETIMKITEGLKISPNELFGYEPLPKEKEISSIINLLRLWEKAGPIKRESVLTILGSKDGEKFKTSSLK